MKMFLYMTMLLLLSGSGLVTIRLNGQSPGRGTPTKSGARTLRIAVVQMKSLDHDIDGNLVQATKYADEAAARGAQFVLFPEFLATGSYLSFDTWDSAEASPGKSVRWLKSTSRDFKSGWVPAFWKQAARTFTTRLC